MIKKGRPHGHRYGNSRKERISLSPLFDRDASKKDVTGIHDRFLRDHVFRKSCDSNMIEMKMFVLRWHDLAQKDFSIDMSVTRIFSITDKKWWISVNKSGDTGGPLRNRSDFNQALSTLNRLHRESGETTTQAHCPTGSISNGNQSSSSSSTWWQWRGSLVELPKNSKKVHRMSSRAKRLHDRTEKPVVYRSLYENPQTNGVHEFMLLFSVLLQIDRLQLTAVYCNRLGGVKTTPQKDPFSQCEISTKNSRTSQKFTYIWYEK